MITFIRQGTVEEKATIELEAHRAVDVLVEYTSTTPPESETQESKSAQPALMRGVVGNDLNYFSVSLTVRKRLGGCRKIDPDGAIQAAVELAANCDAVVFVAGLTPEWESEGFDRPTLQLPGRQDEAISRIAAVNPNTVVCIQSVSFHSELRYSG